MQIKTIYLFTVPFAFFFCFFFCFTKVLTVPLQPSMKIFYFWCLHSYSSCAQIEKHTNRNRMELN